MIGLSVRRPVAVTMLYFCVALLGISAWRNIPVESYPDTSFPRLYLSYSWPGASPETAEAFATSPIEAAVQQVQGVERITSQTSEGRAQITVEFARGTDMDFVRMELSERLGAVEESLPQGASAITIRPYIPQALQSQASRPFLSYTFTGPLLVEALRLHLEENVLPEILKIPGVSDIRVDGGRERLIAIETQPERIASLGLSTAQIASAINQLAQTLPSPGAVRTGAQEWEVTLRNRPLDVEELRTTILPINRGEGAPPIRLEDVATVRNTFEEATSYYRINRSPAVRITVEKGRGVNTLAIAERVKARMAELESSHPPGARVILDSDESVNIRREMSDLQSRALISAVVIFVVLLAFLRSLRTAAIIFATIAFSILIALNLIYFGGLTLNLFTMMGLALGFGLIVDNSIVVLENIHRKWEEGEKPLAASESGARDVILPILASTFTTLIVFIPFLYMQGELRIYYLPLAIVVALTLTASIFVAFTFIPALTARTLRKERKGVGALALHDEERQPIYIRFYQGLLANTLRHPWMTIVVVAVCLGASWYAFDNHVTRGSVFGGGTGTQRSYINISFSMPRGTDLARMDQIVRSFEDRIGNMPEVSQYTTSVNEQSASIRVEFPEELEFTPIPLVIHERIGGFALGFTGVRITVTGVGQSFSAGSTGSTSPNYRLTLLGYNYERLGEIAEDLGGRLSYNSRVEAMNTNASVSGTGRLFEVVASIDRDAAARHGISIQEAASFVAASIRNPDRPGSVILGGEDVGFEVKLAGFQEADVGRLLDMIVVTPGGVPIPLRELIRVEEREVVQTITRENQQYERTIAYEFRGPALLGNAIRDAEVQNTVLPPGYSIRDRSTFQISTSEQQQIRLVLLIALGLVFMVTAALYESIRQPFCVLLTVPMALIGVFLIFFYARINFTREAYIGVIMMGGIVVNNAILLIDHINRVRAEAGLPLFEAVVKATLERVRPILMTTATTVFGLLPLVLFTPTVNATIWNALAYALIGGLLSSTLFVLTATPAIYYLLERGKAARVGEGSGQAALGMG